jgi:protein-S-isoprenylcysteine O-methyltransferase Ste14
MRLKIPPPIVALICALFMGLITVPTPFASIKLALPVLEIASVVLLFVGLSINITALLSFRKAETTINPLKPETAGHLVNTGLYRFSRNPMYLGMLIVLIAWGLWLANWVGFAGPALFMAFITRFQIIPEEQALEQLFPDDFVQFKQATRRWL